MILTQLQLIFLLCVNNVKTVLVLSLFGNNDKYLSLHISNFAEIHWPCIMCMLCTSFVSTDNTRNNTYSIADPVEYYMRQAKIVGKNEC